jgi:hypothetical protein
VAALTTTKCGMAYVISRRSWVSREGKSDSAPRTARHCNPPISHLAGCCIYGGGVGKAATDGHHAL